MVPNVAAAVPSRDNPQRPMDHRPVTDDPTISNGRDEYSQGGLPDLQSDIMATSMPRVPVRMQHRHPDDVTSSVQASSQRPLVYYGYENPATGYIRMHHSYIQPRVPNYINVQQQAFPYLEALASSTSPITKEENEYITLPEPTPPCLTNVPVDDAAAIGGPSAAGHAYTNTNLHLSGASSASSASYIPKGYSQQTLQQPPAKLQSYLNNLCIRREFATFVVNETGGSVDLFTSQTTDSHLFVSADALTVVVSPNSVSESRQLVFLRSRNFDDYPQHIPSQRYRSDVIHMLPHGMSFQRPISVRIPLREGTMAKAAGRELSLMYSESISGTKNPKWRTLRKSSSGNAAAGAASGTEPSWFFADGCLFLSVTHFCMFLVVDQLGADSSGGQRNLVATLSLAYRPLHRFIAVSVTFEDAEVVAEQNEVSVLCRCKTVFTFSLLV